MKNTEYLGVELSKSSLIQHICMAAASEYVDDTTIETIDGDPACGCRITLEIKGHGYCTPLNHELVKRIKGMMMLVQAYKSGILPETVFETAFQGVFDNYMKQEYEEHLPSIQMLEKMKKEWQDWCDQPFHEGGKKSI